MYEDVLHERCATQYAPGRVLLGPHRRPPAAPSDNPNDENRGDVHYWDVWHGNKPFTDYRQLLLPLLLGVRLPVLPVHKDASKPSPLAEDRNIFSCVMEKHQTQRRQPTARS